MIPPASTNSPTYEALLKLVQDLPLNPSQNDRVVMWCHPQGVIGVSRGPLGHVEIFICGPELHSRSQVVRENLEHQKWYRQDGDPLLANRVLLPAAGHFDQVAAFICTELLRNGIVYDLRGGFARTEPVLELAIERLRLADRAILGLSGELILLGALLDRAGGMRTLHVLESWSGFMEAPRDFQLDKVGVEVKTTSRSASSHMIQGIHQVEPGHPVRGDEETHLFLVSLGVAWAERAGDGAVTLPGVIERILRRLTQELGPAADDATRRLVERIQRYGSTGELGYHHPTMAESPPFTRPFRLMFSRGYDMTDPAVRLLTTDDLRARPFIDPGSIRFRLNLPEQVSGDMNPTVGLASIAERLLSAWAGG